MRRMSSQKWTDFYVSIYWTGKAPLRSTDFFIKWVLAKRQISTQPQTCYPVETCQWFHFQVLQNSIKSETRSFVENSILLFCVLTLGTDGKSTSRDWKRKVRQASGEDSLLSTKQPNESHACNLKNHRSRPSNLWEEFTRMSLWTTVLLQKEA